MTDKTFNLYCDESTHLEHDGQPYMLYGFVSIASNQIIMAKEQIKNIKAKYNYNDELKWTNVHDKTYDMYCELVKYFSANRLLLNKDYGEKQIKGKYKKRLENTV